MTNKYRHALARWLDNDAAYSKTKSEFNSDELAELFPQAKDQDQEFLRHVACMQFAVGPSRFQWILKMANYCLAVEAGNKIDEETGEIEVEAGNKIEEETGEIEDVVLSDEEEEDTRTIADVIFHDSDEDSTVEEEVVVEEGEQQELKEDEEWEDRRIQMQRELKEDEEWEDRSIQMDVMKDVYEAFNKLNSIDLAKSFLKISVDYKGQDHEKLKKFEACMNLELNRKTIPIKRLTQLPEIVLATYIYPETARQINQLDVEALESFVMKNLESTCARKESMTHESISSNCTENAVQYEFEVVSCLVLALVLKVKSDVLIGVWQRFEENTKHPVDDKILILAWVISLVVPWDPMVGAFLWMRHLFPYLESKSDISPRSRDVIMQWMVCDGYCTRPPYKYNLGVRQSERVVPTTYLERLARAAFPAESKEMKATKTLREGYRYLKNVALCASPGSEVAKQISEQLIPFAVKAAGEGNSYLAKEARNLFFCCLTNHPDSFKQWDNMFLENLDGSVFILEKLSVKWLEVLSMNLSILGPMIWTMMSVALKTKEALLSAHDTAHQANLERAQEYAKSILEKASNHCRSIMGLCPMDESTVRLGNLKEVPKHNGLLSGTFSLAFGVALRLYSRLSSLRI